MFNARFYNSVLVMRDDALVGDYLACIRHCFPEIFFGISSIVGMISTHLDTMIIGKAFISSLEIDIFFLCC